MAPEWGPDHDAIRELWSLDPAVAYLNHGSFGATPRPVLDLQARLRTEMEREPVQFLDRMYAGRVAVAREAVAGFLGADPAGLAFVPNATAGIATALAAFPVGPGDEIVTTDHAYAAIRLLLRRHAERHGATLRIVPVDLHGDPADLVTERAALVVVDQVTSPTALLFPVEKVVAECRARGVPCVVDGAHAPGLLPVDLAALDADCWTGNLHKWCCAPKGAGVLVVRAELRDRVHPLVVSHGAGLGFTDEFDWTGTHDPTPWLAAPAAIGVLDSIGWERIRSYGRDLVRWGAELVGSVPVAPATQMGIVEIDPLTPAQGIALNALLYAEHRVEVPVQRWRDRCFLRLSAQVYNRQEDFERLADALPVALAAVRSAST